MSQNGPKVSSGLAGLGWAGLAGLAGLGWAALGWAGLGWAALAGLESQIIPMQRRASPGDGTMGTADPHYGG